MNLPILGQTALAYSPVIDRNRSVIATRLTVMPLTQGAALDATDLLSALAETWPEGGPQLWLNIGKSSQTALDVSGARSDKEKSDIMNTLEAIWQDDTWLPE